MIFNLKLKSIIIFLILKTFYLMGNDNNNINNTNYLPNLKGSWTF